MCGRSIASSDAREHWCCRGKGGPRPALPANPGGQNVTDVLTQDVTHVMTSNTLKVRHKSCFFFTASAAEEMTLQSSCAGRGSSRAPLSATGARFDVKLAGRSGLS